MNIRISNVLIMALGLIFAFCGGSKQGSEKAVEKKEELEEFVETQLEYPIPSAFEVSKMLQNANASYQAEAANSPKKADQYVAEWQKALNLGVYGADLSYASTFDKRQETIEFLKVSKKLIEDLNIVTAYNKSMADRIEKNLENKDSLILIITESFYDTYNSLNQNGDEKTSLLVVAGSVIEGLYLTSSLIKSSNYNADLMTVLANQKDQVSKLTELMEKYAEDKNVNKVLPFLRYVNSFYDQLGGNGEITQGQFDDISKSISEMRSQIVG